MFVRAGCRIGPPHLIAAATEVATECASPAAGHSVVVLLKIYAHCIDGQADPANKRIADVLGGDDSRDDQGQDDQAS